MKALGPGALVAGQLAEAIRSRAMSADSLAWLKVNFFRTELELGHCLRLPGEGPCKCDLYLTCAKFVTTPEYAPRLRERRIREITLTDEALVKGFHREAERHDCTRKRIEELLNDLGEPDPPPTQVPSTPPRPSGLRRDAQCRRSPATWRPPRSRRSRS